MNQQSCTMPMTRADALRMIGGLSTPSKMPGHAYSIPAARCHTGSKLRNIKGSVCSHCYACKGHYPFANVQNAMTRRFRSLRKSSWVDAMVVAITEAGDKHFRWHDSGDVQGVWHLENIAEVCRRTPQVRHYLPTREAGFLRQWIEGGGQVPKNLTIRISANMIDGPTADGLAKRLGVQVSGVLTKGWSCKAPSQGNQCGECRDCWDKRKFKVTYHAH